MKREIKFRVWDSKEGKILHGNNGLCMFLCSGVLVWQFADNFDILQSYTRQDRYYLMQFTGLKDKNGKEIYEGDIVRFDWRRHPELPCPEKIFIAEIFYSIHAAGFFLSKHKSESELRYKDETMLTKYRSTKCEIIGNIYENPEKLNT
jgi:uncharacterized phage protein (TIGR01671 family)